MQFAVWSAQAIWLPVVALRCGGAAVRPCLGLSLDSGPGVQGMLGLRAVGTWVHEYMSTWVQDRGIDGTIRSQLGLARVLCCHGHPLHLTQPQNAFQSASQQRRMRRAKGSNIFESILKHSQACIVLKQGATPDLLNNPEPHSCLCEKRHQPFFFFPSYCNKVSDRQVISGR